MKLSSQLKSELKCKSASVPWNLKDLKEVRNLNFKKVKIRWLTCLCPPRPSTGNKLFKKKIKFRRPVISAQRCQTKQIYWLTSSRLWPVDRHTMADGCRPQHKPIGDLPSTLFFQGVRTPENVLRAIPASNLLSDFQLLDTWADFNRQKFNLNYYFNFIKFCKIIYFNFINFLKLLF